MTKRKGSTSPSKLSSRSSSRNPGRSSPEKNIGTKWVKTWTWSCNWKYIFLIPLLLAYGVAFYPEALRTWAQYLSLAFKSMGDLSIKDQHSVSNFKEGGNSIPEGIKNYNPHWQKTFSVKEIFSNGRRIVPKQLMPEKDINSSVRLYVFDGFLSDSECAGLIKAHKRHIREMDATPLLCFDSLDTLRSHLKEVGWNSSISEHVFSPGTLCLNASFSAEIQTFLNSNWSYSTAFYPKESSFSTTVAQRISSAMGLSPQSGGKFQITSYPVGKAYKTHTDCVLGGTDLRERVVSVIMYLNDVTDGGETTFPALGVSVTPRKGRALVWNNMNTEGVCEHDSRHIASVIKSGSKYILMRWYYYKSFYSIGKRMAGPSLPPRGPDVPMVMCDVYTHGSCRWYDEWTPQVLTHYASDHHGYV